MVGGFGSATEGGGDVCFEGGTVRLVFGWWFGGGRREEVGVALENGNRVVVGEGRRVF